MHLPEESLSNQPYKQLRKGSINNIKGSYYLHQKELIQQNTKLMDQVHTMRIKTDKLDSLILEEHDNLKKCVMELDLLKQRLITNSMNKPQEKLDEDVTLCHKCD